MVFIVRLTHSTEHQTGIVVWWTRELCKVSPNAFNVQIKKHNILLPAKSVHELQGQHYPFSIHLRFPFISK